MSDPDHYRQAARRVAALWLVARRDADLWQRFLDAVYEGGKKLVRNTNRDTRDRYPKVEVTTLLRTDPAFRKLLRGQFNRWKAQQEKAGPRGTPVEDVGQLQRGQTVEWTQDRQTTRGTVQKARPGRAILRTEGGRTVHMRPTDLDSWNPRVL